MTGDCIYHFLAKKILSMNIVVARNNLEEEEKSD